MINGNKIKLRSLRMDDLPSINKWRNNLQNRILTQGYRGPVTMEIDSEWLSKVLNNTSNRDIYFGIEKEPPEGLTGIIQLNEIDYVSGVAACGILIGEKEARGKGTGIEAVRALLFYAFFVLNLRKVISYIAEVNKQAFRVQEKVGPVHNEGCLRSHYYFNGKFVDLHIQSFFREDFEFLKHDYTI
jgi:RimJ/RimL family protein N-acetyltransferase